MFVWKSEKGRNASLTRYTRKEHNKNIMSNTDLKYADRGMVFEPGRHASVRLEDGVSVARGKLHEVCGNGSLGFVACLVGLVEGPVIWVGYKGQRATLNPDGLAAFFDPSRLIMVRGLNRADVLWAGEPALRHRGAGGVVMELGDGPDLRESRRLQIAAEEGGALGLAILRGRAQTSAAHMRWQCEAQNNRDYPARWDITKSKDGQRGSWRVRYTNRVRGENAPGLVSLASASAA